MKSKASSPRQKSPSREALLKSAAEQYHKMVRNRLIASQDEVPHGYFQVSELCKTINVNESTFRKMMKKCGNNPTKFKVFTGASLQLVDHYKLT